MNSDTALWFLDFFRDYPRDSSSRSSAYLLTSSIVILNVIRLSGVNYFRNKYAIQAVLSWDAVSHSVSPYSLSLSLLKPHLKILFPVVMQSIPYQTALMVTISSFNDISQSSSWSLNDVFARFPQESPIYFDAKSQIDQCVQVSTEAFMLEFRPEGRCSGQQESHFPYYVPREIWIFIHSCQT